MTKETTKDSLKNLYLIYGEEDYLKKLYCKKIIKKSVTAFEEFNFQKFDGVPDMQKLAAAITNLPLMSATKCVVLRDAATKDFDVTGWKQLDELIKGVPPECVFVIYYDAEKPTVKKDKRFASLVTKVKKLGEVLEVNAPSENQMFRFISKIAADYGCEIDKGLSDYLAASCGGSMNRIDTEFRKVCSYAGSGKITKEQIDSLVIKPMTSSIYDLAKAVVSGRLDTAMKILDELIAKKEEPIVILSALSGSFCDLYRAKAAASSGAREKDVVTDFSYRFAFRVTNAFRDSRSLSLEFLEKSLELLMKADREMKSTPIDKKTILEKTIIEIDKERREQGAKRYGTR